MRTVARVAQARKLEPRSGGFDLSPGCKPREYERQKPMSRVAATRNIGVAG
jgi:hypothetical protein